MLLGVPTLEVENLRLEPVSSFQALDRPKSQMRTEKLSGLPLSKMLPVFRSRCVIPFECMYATADATCCWCSSSCCCC